MGKDKFSKGGFRFICSNPLNGYLISDISNTIHKYRKHLNLTQKEIGEKLNISQQQVAKLESGKAGYTIKTLEKIAGVLNCRLTVNFKSFEHRRRNML